jgi:hypothetical protein
LRDEVVEARNVLTGVSLDTLLDAVETGADYALAFGDGGYTTNVPLEDLTGGKTSSVSQFWLIMCRRRPRLRGRPRFLAGWPARGMGREIWRR